MHVSVVDNCLSYPFLLTSHGQQVSSGLAAALQWVTNSDSCWDVILYNWLSVTSRYLYSHLKWYFPHFLTFSWSSMTCLSSSTNLRSSLCLQSTFFWWWNRLFTGISSKWISKAHILSDWFMKPIAIKLLRALLSITSFCWNSSWLLPSISSSQNTNRFGTPSHHQ